MKHLIAFFLAVILLLSTSLVGFAQAAETIWMETDKDSYNPGEAVTVTIKANSASTVQGFTFNLRYDPACLQPEIPSSLVPGLNYMALPQTDGIVSAIFASTTKINVNGGIASVVFKARSSCQTSLSLVKASLAVAGADGLAASLPGITLGTSSIMITVSGTGAAGSPVTSQPFDTSTAGTSEPSSSLAGSTPGVLPENSSDSGSLLYPVSVIGGLLILGGAAYFLFPILKKRRPAARQKTGTPLTGKASLVIKRGRLAGVSIPVEKYPCRIGSSLENEIRLVESRVAPNHAEILADPQGFTIIDLGSPDGTFINGRLIKNQQSPLHYGDVLRLGGVLLVFSQE